MDRSGATSRASNQRRPLAEATNRFAVDPTFLLPNASKRPNPPLTSSESCLPHHESIAANGPLTIRNATKLDSVHDESKRSSQASTSSNGASVQGRRRKSHIGPWQLGGDLGKGGCGKVRKCRHSLTGQEAAVKIIEKKTAEKARAESLMSLTEAAKLPGSVFSIGNARTLPFGIEREVVIMKLIEHPNVVKLYDVWENRDQLYLVMERVEGGELFSLIENSGYLVEDEAVWILRQVLAALLHCHRLGIHHRDLKPENILLDGGPDHQVKLVDFGMAALQPQGRHLTTPCGSIHYAAPEVFEKKYDGSKIDVWSLGVILYVMLCGSTPFQYDHDTMDRDTWKWYRTIKNTSFTMPNCLSPEAKDLLSRMIVADASKRISLEACWHHPLIQKWSRLWSPLDPNAGRLIDWIGESPYISNWTVHSANELDMDIIRSLRTLWHSQKDQVLIDRLLNDKPNLEKYFYSALAKHREEQLENYQGGPDGFIYSDSDYHHMKAPNPEDLPPIPESAYTRTKSIYSIMPPPSRSKASLPNQSASERSYDPYRSSRDPIIDRKNNYNVTLLRGGSKHSRGQGSLSGGKTSASLRIDAIKNEHRLSTISKSSNSLRSASTYSTSRKRPLSRSYRSLSRSSMSSSGFPSSPPIIVRPVHRKRPVNFSHIRHGSTASGNSSAVAEDSAETEVPQEKQIAHRLEELTLKSSPARQARATIKSRKERLPESTNTNIDLDARKFSAELEKYCEELFFRSSITSETTHASTHETYDTPPSSLISHSGDTQTLSTPVQPLPTATVKDVSQENTRETPNTFIARELAETRRRLADRCAHDDSARNSTYDDVIAHLDALLNQSPSGNNNGRRIHSAPEPITPEQRSYLTSIVEEAKAMDPPGSRQFSAHRNKEDRVVSDPTDYQHRAPLDGRHMAPANTIRMVDESSPPRVKPLVIRKTASIMSATDRKTSVSDQGNQQAIPSTRMLVPEHELAPMRSTSEISRYGQVTDSNSTEKEPKKRWMFGKGKAAFNNDMEMANNIKSKDFETDHEMVVHDRKASGTTLKNSNSTVVPYETRDTDKGQGFLKFWKKSKAKASEYKIADEAEVTDSISSDGKSNRVGKLRKKQSIINKNASTTHNYDNKELGVQQHWIARLFHIKPATKVICFNRGVGIARGEIVRLLRSWKMYGMKDVHFDREKGLIWGRLGPDNYLGIKEVSFAVQLFIILKQDRRAKLSIARFTQIRGSASSFRKIMDYVETVLDGRGYLITDSKVKKEMTEVIDG